jgi:hypothetical protein
MGSYLFGDAGDLQQAEGRGNCISLDLAVSEIDILGTSLRKAMDARQWYAGYGDTTGFSTMRAKHVHN